MSRIVIDALSGTVLKCSWASYNWHRDS